MKPKKTKNLQISPKILLRLALFQMDCGIQCSIDKDCFSFKFENTFCHHGGIQQPSNEIEAEVYMQKPICKLQREQ